MLKERVITASILIALFLSGLFLLSPLAFTVAIGVVVTYAAWEWSDFSGLSSPLRVLYVAALACLLVVVASLLGLTATLPVFNIEVARVFLLTGCLWWLIAFFLVMNYPGSEQLWGSSWARSVVGFLVLVPTWVAVATLIHFSQGVWLMLLVILIVVLADVGAYFSGKRFGKNKLAPGVSPGKTWEGFFGGMAANIVLVLVLGLSNGLSAMNWLVLAVVVIATSAISVLGDLLESMFKRYRGIKDSGSILPGHGGVMDRIDSLSAALPVFTLLYLVLGLNL